MAAQVDVSSGGSAAQRKWRPSWTDLAAVALLLSVVLATWVPRLRGPIDLRYDAGHYFMLGTALAQNKGYRLLSEPGEVLANHHPPGLPAIVALYQRFLRTSDPWVAGEALRRLLLRLLYCDRADLVRARSAVLRDGVGAGNRAHSIAEFKHLVARRLSAR